MNKIIDVFILVLIFIFFFIIYSYYSSNQNIKSVNLNRLNIEKIINNKISNLDVLENDTNNITEFNTLFSNEIKTNKRYKRNNKYFFTPIRIGPYTAF